MRRWFPSFKSSVSFRNSPLVALSDDKGFRALRGATNATRVGWAPLFEKSLAKTFKIHLFYFAFLP
jgi:hypothetical protein